MAVTEARIETLTATVTALVVGQRQVTMSVFNQLDWVAPEDIRPFGRVRTRDGVAVVGTDANGCLVRASLPSPETVCPNRYGDLVSAERAFADIVGALRNVDCQSFGCGRVSYCSEPLLLLAQRLTDRETELRLRLRLLSLDLIVLAGLR